LAFDDPELRKSAVGEAEDGWTLLSRKLGRDEVPLELQAMGVKIALVLDGKFSYLGAFDPTQPEENALVEDRLRKILEALGQMLDGVQA